MLEEKLNPEKFLLDLGRYVSLVQNNVHVRRARVAMLWSAISFFYIVFGLKVSSADVSILRGVAIDNIEHWKFLVFLFAMTLYYAARFGFSVAKICAEVNPRTLWRKFRDLKKFKELDWPIEEIETHLPRMYLYVWIVRPDMAIAKSNPPEEREIGMLDAEKLAGIEKENEVRQSLRYPTLAFLENFFAMMFLPAFVCGMAFLSFGAVVVIWAVKCVC